MVHFFHKDLTAGYQSVKSTLERIQATYWWDKKAIKDAIEKHVLGCSSCSYNKVRRKKLATGLQPMPISGPWQDVHLDVCEFTGEGRNQQVLIMVDRFTKYVELEEIKTPTYENIKAAFDSCILFRHGHPSTVVTDNAKYFKKLESYLESLISHGSLVNLINTMLIAWLSG